MVDLQARVNHLEARTMTLELMLRAVLASQVARAKQPMALLDEFKRDFDRLVDVIQFDIEEDQAQLLRQSLRHIFHQNVAAIAARIQMPAQEEAEGKSRQ